MARALLDTDILSEVFRGKNESVRRHAETYLTQHGQLTTSVEFPLRLANWRDG
jgi:hypothetical protein